MSSKNENQFLKNTKSTKQDKKAKWLDVDIKKEETTQEDLEEMKELLKEFN